MELLRPVHTRIIIIIIVIMMNPSLGHPCSRAQQADACRRG